MERGYYGYLACGRDEREVYIPNEEVCAAFANAVKGTDWTPVVQAMIVELKAPLRMAYGKMV